MKAQPKRPIPAKSPANEEVQQGQERGVGKEERLEHAVRQHPQRDEPRVDSVEPGEGAASTLPGGQR